MRLVLALALAVPCAAAAQAPVACHPDQATQIADAPVDLGEGVVYQYLYPGTAAVPDSVVLFTDCASGVKIAAALPELSDGTRRTVDEVALIMSTALTSGQTFTVDEVVAAMTQAGAPAQLRSSPREDCACALYYPEMRGDKEPWVAP